MISNKRVETVAENSAPQRRVIDKEREIEEAQYI